MQVPLGDLEGRRTDAAEHTGTELRPGADRAATWKRGGSALFSGENDRLVSCWAFGAFRAKKQQVSEFCPIFPEQNWALAHNKQCARYKTYIVLASRCPGGTYATITLYEQHLLHTQCLKTLIFLSC